MSRTRSRQYRPKTCSISRHRPTWAYLEVTTTLPLGRTTSLELDLDIGNIGLRLVRLVGIGLLNTRKKKLQRKKTSWKKATGKKIISTTKINYHVNKLLRKKATVKKSTTKKSYMEFSRPTYQVFFHL